MRKAYLTIDDSPSKHTDDLTDFLVMRGVPAVLFARGEFMENPQGFEKIVRAIEKGFVIGNHSYWHDRTSVVGFENQAAQIVKTQDLIERAYKRAGERLAHRYFRFPHMDRGTGSWVVDYDRVPVKDRAFVQNMFWEGLNAGDRSRPAGDLFDLKARMQDWLKAQGFEKLSTPLVTHPWFVGSEMADAIDAMYTFSTSDWMLTPRHKGRHSCKTLDDLKRRIDTDEGLQAEDSAHIILAHDDREDSLEITTSLIDHMLDADFEFLPIA